MAKVSASSAVKKEREACAKLAEKWIRDHSEDGCDGPVFAALRLSGREIASAIRKRK